MEKSKNTYNSENSFEKVRKSPKSQNWENFQSSEMFKKLNRISTRKNNIITKIIIKLGKIPKLMEPIEIS